MCVCVCVVYGVLFCWCLCVCVCGVCFVGVCSPLITTAPGMTACVCCVVCFCWCLWVCVCVLCGGVFFVGVCWCVFFIYHHSAGDDCVCVLCGVFLLVLVGVCGVLVSVCVLHLSPPRLSVCAYVRMCVCARADVCVWQAALKTVLFLVG